MVPKRYQKEWANGRESFFCVCSRTDARTIQGSQTGFGKGCIGDLSVMPLLKLSEAARLTSSPEKCVREAVKAGELVSHRFGRAFQIRRADLEAWTGRQFEG